MPDAAVALDMAPGVGLGFAAGLVLAHVHLAALALNVRLYLSPGAGWRPVGLHLARVVVTVLGFGFAAGYGAPPLIAMLAGFTVGRMWVLRHSR